MHILIVLWETASGFLLRHNRNSTLGCGLPSYNVIWISPYRPSVVSSLLFYKLSFVSFPLQTPLSEQAPHHQEKCYIEGWALRKIPKAQKTTWASGSDVHSPYLLHCFFSLNSYLWLYGEILITKWQKKKRSGLVYRWFCMTCWHYLKVDDHSTIALLKGKFEGEWWKNFK